MQMSISLNNSTVLVLVKSTKLRANSNSNSNSKLELDDFEPSTTVTSLHDEKGILRSTMKNVIAAHLHPPCEQRYSDSMKQRRVNLLVFVVQH